MARAPAAVAIDAATRKAQADASNPRASAWVSANAGSGKTFVLSQRVIRLLLAGTDPGRILCLTFTKAAAAEMAKRVFDRLAEWTTLPDSKLAAAIAEIEGKRPDAATLAKARRLFARALETPGGLKIQTIHAFCERLLHQFPFEANVAGHFEVLDQRDADALADAARRTVLARAAADGQGPLGRALETVLASASDLMHETAVKEFVAKRDRVRAWIVAAGSLDEALGELRTALGLGSGETVAGLRGAILAECALADELARLVALLLSGGKTDLAAAERLSPALEGDDDDVRIDAYLDFWTKKTDGELRVAASLVTNKVKKAWPRLDEMLEAERERLAALLDRIAAAECYESTAAMLRLADAAIGEYDRLKTARGALDFEDLVVKTATLLSRLDASRWVHYKLDRGLDHILVDEAQDTSPRQWQVVETLAAEFFAGEGASATVRTLFAVGDEKQSIFSFQGAVPAWFTRMRQALGERARRAGFGWSEPELHLSFRSVPAVLAAVDTVFSRESAYRGLAGAPAAPVHTAARHRDPGRVILWPMIAPPARPEPEDWTTPLDHLGEKSPEVRLAERIATTIRGWLDRGEPIEATGEPIRPGGILILTRTRGAQTDAINRALKTRGVPIAGADRLILTDHIAVMDLMALGRVMLLPEDDLSLAAVLKSPLIGLGEEELFTVAHGRPADLWQALGHHALTTGGVFAEARARLDAWRKRADTIDPHGFYARILGPDGGRRAFLRRRGAEAEDVLDEFLAQALAYEEAHTPSLEGFLAFLGAAETEIRRDTETLRDEVRVMTVHGAKGLEADVVFLVDTGTQPVHPNHDPRVVALADGRDGRPSPLVWMRRMKAMPAAVEARVKALRAESEEEYRRLLYVGLTRARDRLIVCGTLKERGTDPVRGWHGLVTAALEKEATPEHGPDGAVVALEWRAEAARRVAPKAKQEALTLPAPMPRWLSEPAPPAPPSPRRVTPSTALGGDGPPAFSARRLIEPDGAAGAALVRGRAIHRLLESLPEIAPERRAEAGRAYLAATAPAWREAEREALLAETLRIIGHGDFAAVFAEGSRAEVEIAGRIGSGVISGRIDRLAVTEKAVLIVDYKTNRPAPKTAEEAPHEYVMQLALYRHVLARLYPGKAVAAAILWTDTPALMEIPSAALDQAAKRLLDAMPGETGSLAPAAGLTA
jgi:ATP-dependent helicase/nuclease subunit A